LFGLATPLITLIALLKTPIATATIFALLISARVDFRRLIVIPSVIWHVHILLYGYDALHAHSHRLSRRRLFTTNI
jgi:hypothetical protein